MAQPTFFGEGHESRLQDTIWKIDQKILGALNSGSGGAGGSGTFAGAGSPEGSLTASPGATYYDTTGDDFYVKKTGTGDTGWQLVVNL